MGFSHEFNVQIKKLKMPKLMTSTVDQRKLYNHNLGPAVGDKEKGSSMLLENRNVDLLFIQGK